MTCFFFVRNVLSRLVIIFLASIHMIPLFPESSKTPPFADAFLLLCRYAKIIPSADAINRVQNAASPGTRALESEVRVTSAVMRLEESAVANNSCDDSVVVDGSSIASASPAATGLLGGFVAMQFEG